MAAFESEDQPEWMIKYVKEHKEELESLRKKVLEKGWGKGTFWIIGDENYLEKRNQYATSSFDDELISPRLIFYPQGVKEVQEAVALCAHENISLSVRTGGHQYCGYSSTSPINIQIDLSETFPGYDYNPNTNVLTCGVSHALGDWAVKNKENGIYLPMGVCAHVHLGGHVHTGGWGIVARSHGLLADHVLAFTIILASGDIKRVQRPDSPGDSEDHKIFYAVLGGGRGGDFGIVTEWEFSPLRDVEYPNSMCYQFIWLWSKNKMRRVVQQMQELTKKCADGTIPGDYEFMLTITGAGVMNMMPEKIAAALQVIGFDKDDEVPVPAMIQMWMCYTNKGGKAVQFNEEWFESFADCSVAGRPLIAHRERIPVSEGIADYFIMKQAREMIWPFVKRSRVSMDVPPDFPDTYTDRMIKILGWLGTTGTQHLVSQMQIYAGGEVGKGEHNLTSYSWRQQEFAMSHDAFYSKGFIKGRPHAKAEKWQDENDEVFIGEKKYAEKDMRMFAYTFGCRELDQVWQHYYDSEEKYERLKKIKGELDPKGVFSCDGFSLRP
mmetsp:Transcript_43823/g.61602  ORF Transcript_43823/g.61602 Transcript_43823/m.61602 type:complete len:551 (+) Transcript_43823:247-1899(+)|eukprot:CAMPEP_0201500816 /NCGR_PEP_ID=MMETSP0151_2-20130828/83258_1 /ASSEMBLY_ACC=CAM_ASM_000257 /TAXON_ID=200890 /ORGANISM="Paramoeba atlantica, Strain 621/1 / CCAP 1560/9" /LENGTH=550 /DNA_ID=CAMNT_0047894285 /DNA_START=485 /DNA_END=2137 /DNA_ORIENTATION=-